MHSNVLAFKLKLRKLPQSINRSGGIHDKQKREGELSRREGRCQQKVMTSQKPKKELKEVLHYFSHSRSSSFTI